MVVDWFFVLERFRIEDTGDENTVPIMALLSALFILFPMVGNLLFIANLLRTEFDSVQLQ